MRTVTSTDGTTIAFDRTGRLGAHPGGRCALRSVVRAERHLGELIASDRRAQAVRHFMRKGVGLPAFVVGMMRLMPAWSRLEAVAHTLPYDAAVLGEETGAGMPLPFAAESGSRRVEHDLRAASVVSV